MHGIQESRDGSRPQTLFDYYGQSPNMLDIAVPAGAKFLPVLLRTETGWLIPVWAGLGLDLLRLGRVRFRGISRVARAGLRYKLEQDVARSTVSLQTLPVEPAQALWNLGIAVQGNGLASALVEENDPFRFDFASFHQRVM